MATEYIGLPGELVEKVKEAAARDEITPEELVRGRSGEPHEPCGMAQDCRIWAPQRT